MINFAKYKNQIIKLIKPEKKDKQENNEKDNREYLTELIENLEYTQQHNRIISFTITSLKNKGFTVKVGGLFAYVSFQHMPWIYQNNEHWRIMSRKLIGQKFFCQIYKLEKKPIRVSIDAKIHRFENLEFIEKIEIEGIVISTREYGLFVEVGGFYDWKYGSCIGLLHKNNTQDFETFKNYDIGDEISTYFHGFNQEKGLILGDKLAEIEWFTKELKELIGTNRDVVVTMNEHGNRSFFVDDKYEARLPITKKYYEGNNGTKVKKLLRKIKNNEIINCEIVGIDYKNKQLIVKWNVYIEPTIPQKRENNNQLINRLSSKTSKKMFDLLFSQMIEVTVYKKDKNIGIMENRYFILNNVEGKLKIKSSSYELSERDKTIIERNFKNGDIIKCKVIKTDEIIEFEYNIDR